MKVRIIRDEKDYDEALRFLETKITEGRPHSELESAEIEALALLVEQYEKGRFPIASPDPIQAIQFRMEQANLTPKDLVPIIGSRSKVSEVLSGKRSLSLNMIRSLHRELGIPLHILIGEVAESAPDRRGKLPEAEYGSDNSVNWQQYPLRDMWKRGYFDDLEQGPVVKSAADLTLNAQELMLAFVTPLGMRTPFAAPALFKKTLTTRAARTMSPHALSAWSMRVLRRAATNKPPVSYRPEILTPHFLGDVARLSWSERGPLLARELLYQHGISLVVEPHLPRTHLDGAAIVFWAHQPVIGLTIRHDRLDNFWFCLLHELAHLHLHFWSEDGEFVAGEIYDDLEAATDDPREREADAVAGEALIPAEAWRKSPVSVLASPQAVQLLAGQLRIHPAIVAGRVRHTKNSFRLLNNQVGQGEVRKHFTDVRWKSEEE